MSLISKKFESFLDSKTFFDYTSKYMTQIAHTSETEDSQGKNHPYENVEYLISSSNETQNYCVGMVDMVSSTKTSATLGIVRSSRYYQIFLNSMSRILTGFNGRVIKNIGDCLLFYFPATSEIYSGDFINCLDCCLCMARVHGIINKKLKSESLPSVNYRISVDYGQVAVLRSEGMVVDLFGPPVNMCAKINKLASCNGIVIGGDLYQIVKPLPYRLAQIKGCPVGFKSEYPVYCLEEKIEPN